MTWDAGLASAVVVALVAVTSLPAFAGDTVTGGVVFLAAYFALTLMHTGVRVGRKTYVVDMAEGDQRTTYAAVSHSAMDLVPLVVDGVSSALAVFGVVWALLFLALLGGVGLIAVARLPEVSAG